MPQPASSAQPGPGPQPGSSGPQPGSAVVVDALVEVLAAGTNTAARDFISQHTTPEYRAATPLDAQVAELVRMHRESEPPAL